QSSHSFPTRRSSDLSGLDAAVRNVCAEVIKRLCVARLIIGVADADTGNAAAPFARRSFIKYAGAAQRAEGDVRDRLIGASHVSRSEEHTSELQSLAY